ncbi:multicopper oxidase [Scopulibacillus darangshiensis]|uniref:Multicopper oxidase n=1 Tax=Scopulibacillus darangshiensis TaxID=442528 RepID=A0A4R2P1Q4_9BACL|nr:copper oxidase [Scopulibacillus darangshiensis]TCP27801.1 multicopper oxidase [Scopulibacillus darangshiensis]
MKVLKFAIPALLIMAIATIGFWQINGKQDGDAFAKEKDNLKTVQPITPNVKNAKYEVKDGVKTFHLTAEPVKQEVSKGVYMKAWGYNGGTPGPTIVTHKGDKVRIVVKNNLDVPTSVHWHGLIVPNKMDGVPGVENSPKIKPGDTFTYEFTVKQVGTFMYHSHVNPAKQEMMGLSGMFIALPKKGNKIDGVKVDRDYSIMLNEWSLQGSPSDDGSMKDMDMGGMDMEKGSSSKDGKKDGMSGMDGFEEGKVPPGTYNVNPEAMMWNVFTFNGKQFPATQPMEVKKGETVLLRLGNISMQNHPIHLHGHNFKVVAKDGTPLPKAAQYEANTIDVAPGETYDVVFKANNPGTWIIHCHLPHHTAGMSDTEEGGMLNAFHYDGTPWPPAFQDKK